MNNLIRAIEISVEAMAPFMAPLHEQAAAESQQNEPIQATPTPQPTAPRPVRRPRPKPSQQKE